MDKKQSGLSKLVDQLLGKGFYIVLFLCIAVIGVSAWVLVDSLGNTGAELEESLSTKVSARLPETSGNGWMDTGLIPPTTASPEPSEAPAVTQLPAEQTPEPEPDTVESDETVETIAEPPAPDAYVWPVSGQVERPHSLETLVYDKTMADWRTHRGLDIAASLGTKVVAAAAGTVTRVEADPMYGTTVEIEHGGGIVTRYCNLAATPAVEVGQSVGLGQVIGAVGDTAIAEAGDVTHLHFEMLLYEQPVDPAEYLPAR